MRARRSARAGLTLVEVLVAMAIGIGLFAVAVSGLSNIQSLQQRAAARRLAVTYERIHEEAVMRNRSFRVVYFLDENRYEVQTGEEGAVLAATPEDLEIYQKRRADKTRYMNEEELAEFRATTRQAFEQMTAAGVLKVKLPSGVAFGGVYTPQYGRTVRPGEETEDDEPLRVSSHVLNSGFSENTVVWLVHEDDHERGWTLEVQPLSGTIRIHDDVIDFRDLQRKVPEVAPELPL